MSLHTQHQAHPILPSGRTGRFLTLTHRPIRGAGECHFQQIVSTAAITGPTADLNLGIQTFVNASAISPVQIDTSQAATDTIDYVATDQNGLTSTSTRTVIIEAPSSPGNTASSSTTPDTSTIEATTTDTSATTQ